MEKYDGASALHFLSHNFEGHEIISVTLWGNPEIQQCISNDVGVMMEKAYREAWASGGNLRLCVQEMGELHPCIYHIDTYYEETHDVDSILNEYARLLWTNNDEPESPDEGGDE
tara:strand:+ start:44 stop:385 length:342 start_codon:yes stop_codon:yes gene_type:complete